MVLACESIFSRAGQTTKLAHILKSKPKLYTVVYLPNGASKIKFSLALQL